MFILDFIGEIRTVLFFIDQVAYSLIDDAYNLIVKFASASFFKDSAIEMIMKNTYIIIGLFALFKIAVLLVNALVSPDKLFDKEKGFGAIVRNIVIMFALLIFVPILFKESMKIQNTIVNGSYINKLFGLNVPNEYNPGDMFKRQAILALVHPNVQFVETKNDEKKSSAEIVKDGVKYKVDNKWCLDNSTHCKKAIEDYNEALFGSQSDHMFSTLASHMGDYVKNDFGNGTEKIYVYDYSMFLTFIVGIAITYLLILFCFDLAERVIKLAILEVVSPLFIVTYIDPKSAKSGPFNNWLKEVGSTYVGLYIRLAALSLIIILTTLWQEKDIDLGFLGNIIFILSILIFAKSFPKWLAGLVGIKDFDNGLGGLGKRLGSAAIVGGMLTKAGHTALGAASGAKRMISENRRNRNALRKQARIDSGATHGKQGRELRKDLSKDSGKTGIKGYFAGRKALHDARKEAYKDAGANLLGKDTSGKNAVTRNLGQIGASIVGGAIVGGQAGLKADNIKGAIKGAGTAANQFGQSLGFAGRSMGSAVASGLNNVKSGVSNAWGTDIERREHIDEREKRENYSRTFTGNYTRKVGFEDAPTSQGGFIAKFKGAAGGFDAVKAALSVQSQFSGGKISTMDDGKIQIQKTYTNEKGETKVHTAVIDGESKTAVVDGKTQNYSDLLTSYNSLVSSYGDANLQNMYNKTVEQGISSQISNNAQIGQLMQQRSSVEQSMMHNQNVINTSASNINSANSDMNAATSLVRDLITANLGVSLASEIVASSSGDKVKLEDATMEQLDYYFSRNSSSLSNDIKENFDTAKSKYSDAMQKRSDSEQEYRTAVNSYNVSSSQVSNINNQISQYQASNNSVENMIKSFRDAKSSRANATLEELQRDAKKEQEQSQKVVDATKEKKE